MHTLTTPSAGGLSARLLGSNSAAADLRLPNELEFSLSANVEREVLRLIARGYLYKEIARRLVD
jgi:DNA-binding CsgD family transcriptional regulator